MQTMTNLSLLRKAYNKLEAAMLDIEQTIKEEAEDLGLIEPVDGATAWVEKGILRITVDECLPRDKLVTKVTKMRWINKIRRALLDINIRFKSALIIIEVYSPYSGAWDVDNRAFSIVINAIRYMKIIPDDSYQHMTFMVAGKMDKERPRTEIFVLDYDVDVQTFVSKLVNRY